LLLTQIYINPNNGPFQDPTLYTNHNSAYSGQSQISLFWPIYELPTPLAIQSRIRQLAWEQYISWRLSSNLLWSNLSWSNLSWSNLSWSNLSWVICRSNIWVYELQFFETGYLPSIISLYQAATNKHRLCSCKRVLFRLTSISKILHPPSTGTMLKIKDKVHKVVIKYCAKVQKFLYRNCASVHKVVNR
jgi:hypothetical protein